MKIIIIIKQTDNNYKFLNNVFSHPKILCLLLKHLDHGEGSGFNYIGKAKNKQLHFMKCQMLFLCKKEFKTAF